ncbi:predicted protein [Coccidioides posadasii C735 delta SOWgp]|uniref:Uncharacterized protein n=1 Tax=Coccidioides posadasii (strain C735) TaxID=222929 RepID=C5P2F8_COCP7|nr:predicted protein [Coccidioides posadasii C735 delta SOWgp]EER29061.1 predicted protein [Coccidioides posadasii C735 delta SOWgp]|eukprot:XP_003071206.1 predicted protein [Coccidioides posadasii C735 delta SOWgp]
MQLAESRGTHKASFEGCEMLLKKRSEAFQNRWYVSSLQNGSWACVDEVIQQGNAGEMKQRSHHGKAMMKVGFRLMIDDDGDEGVTTVQSGQLAKSGASLTRRWPFESDKSVSKSAWAQATGVLTSWPISPAQDSHVQRNQERAQFLHLRQRVRRFSVNPPLTPRSKKGIPWSRTRQTAVSPPVPHQTFTSKLTRGLDGSTHHRSIVQRHRIITSIYSLETVTSSYKAVGGDNVKPCRYLSHAHRS